MLGRVTIPLAVPEPDFVLNILASPLLTVFLLLIITLITIHILIHALELRLNNKMQDLRSRFEQLEKEIKEAQSLAEKNKEDLDSRLKTVEARLIELSSKVEELEKRSSRRSRKTTN